MGQLLDLVRSLGLDQPEQWAGPTQTAPPPAPAPLTGWRKMADESINTVVGTFKGLTGVGDQGPAGPTAINAAAMIGGLVPVGGTLASLEKVATKLPRFAKAIKAFHGSPHDFLPEPGAPLGKFSTAKIGTGEGAQFYGHGLYFAEEEAVAKGYRKPGNHQYTVDTPIDGIPARTWMESKAKTPAEKLAADSLHRNPNMDEAIKALHDDAELGLSGAADAKQWLIDNRARVGTTGKMYEVNINADPEHFLDWDKPLKDQPAAVQKTLAAEIAKQKARGEIMMPDYMRRYEAGTLEGSAVYSGLGDKQRATKVLKEAGVPGVKFFDQGSRGAGQGTRNFVVFDDQLVDILKKYGVAGGAIGLLQYKASQQGGKVSKADLDAVTQ